MLYYPDPILLTIGPLSIHWYGLFMILALIAGLAVSIHIAGWYRIAKDVMYDLFFYVVIFGFLGARLFYVLYNLPYFLEYPLDVFKIWQGGIAIHGALVFGVAVVWWFAKRKLKSVSFPRRRESRQEHTEELTRDPRLRGDDIQKSFWLLASIVAPGLALGQAIGRWGNYFNQELFGLPTNLPWGIPIDLAHRPAGFESFTYFHPTFLYESIGNLLIFAALFFMHRAFSKKCYQLSVIPGLAKRSGTGSYQLIVFTYILLYSALRLGTEFLRIDPTAGSWLGLRATMWLSIIGVAAGLAGLGWLWRHRRQAD